MSGTRVREAKPPKPSKSVQRAPELVGTVPRVDLLPPEVHERQRIASVRSTIILLAILAMVIVGGGYAFASLLVAQSSSALADEQARTLELLSQQQEFIEVRHIQSRVTASEAAERVGLSTEVDWSGIISQVIAAQPAGVSVQNVDIQSVTPVLAFLQPTIPLESPRVASMEVSLVSAAAVDVAALMDGISASVTGVVDVVLVDTVENSGVYITNLVIYFDKDVLVNAQEVTE